MATPVCDDNGGICDESEWVLRITQRCLATIGYHDNRGDNHDDDDGREDRDDDCVLIITQFRLARWKDWSKNNLTAFLTCCLATTPFIIIVIMMGMGMVIMSQIMTVLVMMLMRRLQYRTFEKLMMMLVIDDASNIA